MIPPASAACPCGLERKPGQPRQLADCCGRYLDNFADLPAPDAPSLMRSRYSAFVLQRADYLRATWHVSTRPPDLEFEVGARWLGLAVLRHQVTSPSTAEVEFVARYRVGGRAVRLHETSRFLRENGRWYYLDGQPS